MTDPLEASAVASRSAPWATDAANDHAAVRACCSGLYASPLFELLIGESFHPGGPEGTRELLRASGLLPGERLLDAGCGIGASSRVSADEFGLLVEGVDVSAGAVARARERESAGRIRWTEADLAALPHAGATFDGALAECVLSTVQRGPTLAELRRVLRQGGHLLISDVESGPEPIQTLVGHPLIGAALCVSEAWRPGELEIRLRDTGFTLERQWDCSASILALVDHVEARIGQASTVLRGLGLDLAAQVDGTSPFGPQLAMPPAVRGLGDEVRVAVGRGDLRYFAAVARAA